MSLEAYIRDEYRKRETARGRLVLVQHGSAYSGRGRSDVFVFGRDRSGRGIFGVLEFKTPTGRVRPRQPEFLQSIRQQGGFAYLVRSWRTALAAVEAIMTHGVPAYGDEKETYELPEPFDLDKFLDEHVRVDVPAPSTAIPDAFLPGEEELAAVVAEEAAAKRTPRRGRPRRGPDLLPGPVLAPVEPRDEPVERFVGAEPPDEPSYFDLTTAVAPPPEVTDLPTLAPLVNVVDLTTVVMAVDVLAREIHQLTAAVRTLRLEVTPNGVPSESN